MTRHVLSCSVFVARFVGDISSIRKNWRPLSEISPDGQIDMRGLSQADPTCSDIKKTEQDMWTYVDVVTTPNMGGPWENSNPELYSRCARRSPKAGGPTQVRTNPFVVVANKMVNIPK
jgi:hypothetical protein